MCAQHPDVCHRGRCILPISEQKKKVSNRKYAVTPLVTHRKDANTLQSSDVLVQILHVRMNFMPCCNSCLEYILCIVVLEVSAM